MDPINDPARSHLQTGNGGRWNIGVVQPSNRQPFLIENSLLLAIFALALAVAAWQWQRSHLCVDHVSGVTCRPLKELTRQFKVGDPVTMSLYASFCFATSHLAQFVCTAATVQADSTNDACSCHRKAPDFAGFFKVI